MAKPDKVEVALSNTDRQLLRDIRDALRALDSKTVDIDDSQLHRLVESALGGKVATMCGNTPPDEWDHMLLDDHIVADTKGYTWNGAGWVPKA